MVLDRAIRDAGIPYEGVGIGSLVDRSTWRVFYATAATPAQRSQGANILASLDLADAALVAALKQDVAAEVSGQDALVAVAQAAWECAQSPTTFPTLVSFRARVLQLLRNRL
jgi:hypothetical protein